MGVSLEQASVIEFWGECKQREWDQHGLATWIQNTSALLKVLPAAIL